MTTVKVTRNRIVHGVMIAIPVAIAVASTQTHSILIVVPILAYFLLFAYVYH